MRGLCMQMKRHRMVTDFEIHCVWLEPCEKASGHFHSTECCKGPAPRIHQDCFRIFRIILRIELRSEETSERTWRLTSLHTAGNRMKPLRILSNDPAPDPTPDPTPDPAWNESAKETCYYVNRCVISHILQSVQKYLIQFLELCKSLRQHSHLKIISKILN